MIDLQYEEMTASSDFARYDRLARMEMAAADLVTGDELAEWIDSGRVRAWHSYDGAGQLVGWCAVKTPSDCHPSDQAVHLLGNIVFGDLKGRGFGKAMAKWRTHAFGQFPLTASVQPGNHASEAVLKSCGFRRGLPDQQGPWTVWHRPPDAGQHALVRWLGGSTAQGEHLVKEASSDIVHTLRAGGWTVETAVAGHRPKTQPTCPYGLWPDPAAFHAVIDVRTPD